ncbi:hypothetical protein Ppb6_04018 [Photorhabdus australis subsp. thailandensis]|uniref:Uncharacterized protein n=1 Tax=Photorhabdus australis subsp. thailandensis TaxID=2805096 RepID=A0A1C0TZ18_9GAMM|nr:hypothetical protein Ppb6_04018 [Photorhabdus australis subsp. thailandensis]
MPLNFGFFIGEIKNKKYKGGDYLIRVSFGD